jgi:hypothetical protein
MARKLIAMLGACALALPVLAQEPSYPSQDEQGGWVDGPPYEGDDGARTNVDVSVDLATPGASVTFDTFHDGLAPYGEWITVSGYGRVWRPRHVADGWRPYYYGRWEWTDEGWLWVSDEPWGWAAYHYGRWAYDSQSGWVWIPGYQWAPAWVTWRYSPDYIGWAPLGPGFSVYVTSYPVVYGWWTFVPCRRFVGVPVHSVAFHGGHVRGIFHGTYPAPPRAAVFGARAPAWGGPARPFVEQRLGHAIAPVRVQPVASPAAIAAARPAGVVPIYRPEARVHAPRPATSGHGVMPPPAAQSRGPAAARPVPGSALRGGGAQVGGQPAPRAPAPGSAGVRTAPAPAQGGLRGPANRGGSQPMNAPPMNAPRAAPRPAPAQPRGSLVPGRGDAPSDQGRARAFAGPAAPRPEASFTPPRARQNGNERGTTPPSFTAPRPQQGGFARPSPPPVSTPSRAQQGGFAAPRAQQGGFAAPRAQQGGFVAPRAQGGGFTAPRVQGGGSFRGGAASVVRPQAPQVRSQASLPRSGGGSARAQPRHR